jgi:putative lipoprotein
MEPAMQKTLYLLLALLPALTGCQLFDLQDTPVEPEQVRLLGELRIENGQMLLQPCAEARSFSINGARAEVLRRQSAALLDGQQRELFADLRGTLHASKQADGGFAVTQIYRLQSEGHGCNDQNHSRLLLRASGSEPGWQVQVLNQGLLLQQIGQPDLALPYLEERLPDGRINFSSEADGLRLELWVVPQTCIDSMSGSVMHLRAELRMDERIHQGCAAFGGLRND